MLTRMFLTQEQLNWKLIHAAEAGDLPEVKQAIADGTDIHADNDAALWWAAYHGHLPLVQFLMEHGADVHARYDQALRWAAWGGHLPVVQFLLANGADIHAADDWALQWAINGGHWAVAACLLQYGVDRTKLTAEQQRRLQQNLHTSAQVHTYILTELDTALINNDWQATERVLGIVPVQELPIAIQEQIEHVIAHAALRYTRQQELGSLRGCP